MQGIRSEIRNFTDEQVAEIIAKAHALVSELGIADDLREAAFGQACGMYAQKQIVMEQIAPGLGTMAMPRGV